MAWPHQAQDAKHKIRSNSNALPPTSNTTVIACLLQPTKKFQRLQVHSDVRSKTAAYNAV
jgi:hypothetical protein